MIQLAPVTAEAVLEQHEYAKSMPPLRADEYEALKEVIKERGLKYPVILFEGKILDGWHSYKACREIGAHIHYEEYLGDDPWGCVQGQNLARRHLRPSQLACCAAILCEFMVKERRRTLGYKIGKKLSDLERLTTIGWRDRSSRGKAAKVFGACYALVSQASTLKKRDYSLFKLVWNGSVSMNAAYKEVGSRRKPDLTKEEPIQIAEPMPDKITMPHVFSSWEEIWRLDRYMMEKGYSLSMDRKGDQGWFAKYIKTVPFKEMPSSPGPKHAIIAAAREVLKCP